jgi:transcription initiation factor TFIIB
MDMGPEWRAFDQEQRDRRGRVGAPMTFSIDYREPIVLLKNGRMWVTEIGKFIDEIMVSAKTSREGNLEIAKVEGYSTLAVDDHYKVVFQPISHVTRHSVEELYEVTLETNRKILTSDKHCLYTVKDEEIAPIEIKVLKKEDFIVAPKFVSAPFPPITKINLVDEFLTHPLEEIEDLQVQFDGGERIPILKAGKIGFNDLANAKILLRGGKYSLPCELVLDEKIAKLLGYYTSEGSISKGRDVIFSFGAQESRLIEEVCEILRSLGFNPRLYHLGYATQVVVSSGLLLRLVRLLGAGKNAHEKRVPPVIFSMSREMKMAFLHAYVDGDGCVYSKEEKKPEWRPIVHVYTTSVSKDLSNDMILLYLQLGTFAGYTEEEIPGHVINKTGQALPNSLSTGTRLTNPDAIHSLGFISGVRKRWRKGAIEDLVPAPEKYARLWKFRKRIRINKSFAKTIAEKFGDQKLLKLAESDLVFLRVKSVKKVKPTTNYAYDLTVPEYKNFVAGHGWIIAFDTIHDKGLSTMIDWRDRDFHGKDLTPKRRAQIYRLRKWQRRIRVSDAMERNLAFALSEIDRMASHLRLPRNIREASAVIYRRAVEAKLIRGRSIEGVAAAAIYAACREANIPRTLDEIAEVSRVSKKEIGRSYRFIARELLIHLRPTSPVDYIPRFASELGLSGATQAKAVELLQEANKRGLTSGRGPTGVAAAAIYIASVICGERRTQRDVADIARVTEVTVRNRYKELQEKLNLDIEL